MLADLCLAARCSLINVAGPQSHSSGKTEKHINSPDYLFILTQALWIYVDHIPRSFADALHCPQIKMMIQNMAWWCFTATLTSTIQQYLRYATPQCTVYSATGSLSETLFHSLASRQSSVTVNIHISVIQANCSIISYCHVLCLIEIFQSWALKLYAINISQREKKKKGYKWIRPKWLAYPEIALI